MKDNRFLIAVVFIQAFVIIAQWYGPAAQPARAEIPDAAGQLVQVASLLTTSNLKLDKIIDLLQKGPIQVRVDKSDDSSGK